MDDIYILSGTVVRGKGEGGRHGMPTANLQTADALPPAGVYGGWAILDGQRFPGVTNVGTRPSDDDDPTPSVETLLLNYDGDLYGKTLRLELRFFLRPIRRFPGGLDEVAAQVRLDAAQTLRRLGILTPGEAGTLSEKENTPVARADIRCIANIRFIASDDPRSQGFGRGIMMLLAGVEESGSINRATKSMGMAYSKAWKILKRTEEEFGVTLIRRDGAHGSELTEDARRLLALYRRTQAAAQSAAERALTDGAAQ